MKLTGIAATLFNRFDAVRRNDRTLLFYNVVFRLGRYIFMNGVARPTIFIIIINSRWKFIEMDFFCT